MHRERAITGITRRQLLRGGLTIGSGLALAPLWPEWARAAAGQTAAPADPLAASRAHMGAAPIQATKLTDALTLLSGPGGNVVVLHGPDGKIVVDTFVQPAFDRLTQALDGIDGRRVETIIDTHWHFDHADNNANFRKAGAAVLAHENTATRLREPHELLGMQLPPSPPGMQPTRTFEDTHTLEANGEKVALGYIPPAHTDTDIYVQFSKGNVLHLGDLYFNGIYPFIDAGTGGSIDGMIEGTTMALGLADRATKIVPGHGPLGDRASLATYGEMLTTVRDRVRKLKTSGRTLAETVAEKPTKDLDAVWGKGFMSPDNFVTIVYGTLGSGQ